MSLRDDAERLGQLAEAVPIGQTREIAGQLETIGHAVADILPDPEVLDLIRRALAEIEPAADALAHVQQVLQQVADRHIGGESVQPGSPPVAATAPEPEPAFAIRHEGSDYSPDAAWAVADLPRRVGDSQQHTIARIKIGDTEIPGTFESNRPDAWGREARLRLTRLNIGAPRYVPYHVEMRAAAMMIDSGVRDAEVVMNNVPCGYQARFTGCHQVLARFLPRGSTLTVQGTDQQGRPFRFTYRGSAEQ